MRFSRVSVPTLKEKPADAEIPSHELLIRAGMMRPVAAGIYALLPLGNLALQKIEGIVRREMNKAGALELVLPTIHPSEPWLESGRWNEYGPEMMRLVDRQGRDFCLGPTAEELITSTVARTAPSYRDLPINFYQIQTKFRDEIRPRFGLLRCREFRMMDAYSFHVSEEDLDLVYQEMYQAYIEVARRCSLEIRVVEASTGLMGGDVSQEFMVISEVGEDVVVHCRECDWGASAELEAYRPSMRFGSEQGRPMEKVHTPGLVTVQEVASFLGADTTSVIKCVLYVSKGEPVAVFIPGYREVSEAKLAGVLGTVDFHPLREDERELFPAVVAGFAGPVGLAGVRMIFDSEIKGAVDLICGANEVDHHFRGAQEGRDFKADPELDVSAAVDGDLCVKCGGELAVARGIEIGHIFKLGAKYSEALGAYFTDRRGENRPMIMGTYGIGTSRMLATIVEQHHDPGGIRWPKSVAPLPVHLVMVGPGRAEQERAAREIERALSSVGLEVLLDDREASPGVKFNDADLIGLPLQVVVGKKLAAGGVVDLKIRYSGQRKEVPLGGVPEAIEKALQEAP